MRLLNNATFRCLFLAGLVKHTTATCVIHLDFEKLLPPSRPPPPPVQAASHLSDSKPSSWSQGSVGFYRSASMHRGIELVQATEEHCESFGPSGEYAILGDGNYVVVGVSVATAHVAVSECPRQKDAAETSDLRSAKRMRVRLDPKEGFARAHCAGFGLNGESEVVEWAG